MRYLYKVFALFGIIIYLNSSVSAQANKANRLDSLFMSIFHYQQLNGNILIAEAGKVIYQKSFGFANLENKIPNNDSTRFTLASVSKVFTSTAVLQLREKGKLNLNELVIKYLPDFPYPTITIRNLLSHTSGLPDYQIYEEQISKNPGKVFTNKDILPSLKMWRKPLSFRPGEKWQYSNTNFCLLALIVEKVSGMEFQKYVHRYIFTPAKMYNSYFVSEAKLRNDKNKTINYEYPSLYSARLQDVDSMKKYRWRTYNAGGFVGQGNIMITTTDLLKFDNALYSGKLLKPSTLNEAFMPAKLNNGQNNDASTGVGKASYGLGWFILADSSSGKVVWHTGGQPGALTIFLRNISKKQTVIVFDNAFNRNIYGDGINAMAILNNKPITIRKKSLTREYGSTLVEKGIDEAFCKLERLKADTAHYYMSEDDMNELGLQLLYEEPAKPGYLQDLEVLKLNTLFFPGSFNTYDSYGEALAKAGKKEQAIFMYKKSLQLNPDNEGGKIALKQLAD